MTDNQDEPTEKEIDDINRLLQRIGSVLAERPIALLVLSPESVTDLGLGIMQAHTLVDAAAGNMDIAVHPLQTGHVIIAVERSTQDADICEDTLRLFLSLLGGKRVTEIV